MARYIDAELIEKYISREEHNTPDEKWRPESEFAALVDNIPTADVVEVVRCTECAMHSKCIMEDTFITVGITDGYFRVGRKVEKMAVTDYCTGSCEECMKDAPYEYCCKLECGEHEFCRRCQKADCCSLIITMNGIDKGR